MYTGFLQYFKMNSGAILVLHLISEKEKMIIPQVWEKNSSRITSTWSKGQRQNRVKSGGISIALLQMVFHRILDLKTAWISIQAFFMFGITGISGLKHIRPAFFCKMHMNAQRIP